MEASLGVCLLDTISGGVGRPGRAAVSRRLPRTESL